MSDYDPRKIEAEWQARWDEAGLFRVNGADPARTQHYCLEMLPYPSGKLHMGHVRNYAIGDVVARFHRMKGEQVFHVIGWDSFGLPAENAAIRKGEAPRSWTLDNIATMRSQLKRLGLGYDWSREIATCLPEYYRWNQWFFLRMLEKGIAYRADRPLNWCDSCNTVLANEQVLSGRCWRCDSPVSRRQFEQWFLRITDYAQELLDDLDDMELWPEKVRSMQQNWIGRSDGAEVQFDVDGSDLSIRVFTTRIDTIYGATYVALAAEHPFIQELIQDVPERKAVQAFLDEQLSRTLEDRFADAAEKIGVFTGRYAVNPFSGEKMPIWIANFVLTDVGTGAIMSVPAHDERDFAFARKYGLPIRPVVRPRDSEPPDPDTMEGAFSGCGIVCGSGEFDDLSTEQAGTNMGRHAEEHGCGKRTVTYRLKDWGISRQRYWGTPIPVIHCPECGPVGVPDEKLPVLLPEEIEFTGEGSSPLSRVESFVRTTCPTCHGPARRDTDTMDTFVDSCWYYFRYLDPRNDEQPFDWEQVRPWLPVDLYIGGIEHATMHLIYTRFWTKMMRDLGLVDIDEPVTRLFTQGMVIKDGFKMSKSKGNVVDPDDLVARYGADTIRLFSLFAAPPDRDLEWSEAGVEGCYRFLVRLARTVNRVAHDLPEAGRPEPAGGCTGDALSLRRKTHQTIAMVTFNLGPRMHLNTPVSAVMELINAATPLAERLRSGDDGEGLPFALRECFETVALLLAPFAPHFAEEMWERLGRPRFISDAAWPVPQEDLLVEDEVTIVVQVNGKLRARLSLARGVDRESVLATARENDVVAKFLEGKQVRKVIFVPDKLLNLVIG